MGWCRVFFFFSLLRCFPSLSRFLRHERETDFHDRAKGCRVGESSKRKRGAAVDGWMDGWTDGLEPGLRVWLICRLGVTN